MGQSQSRLVQVITEFRPKEDWNKLPRGLRGFYVLYKRVMGGKKFRVVYVGLGVAGKRNGLRGRLRRHEKEKGKLWTHFSVYAAWKDTPNEEVRELEGLFRHIYRKDPKANALNVQKGYGRANKIRENDLSKWPALLLNKRNP